MKNEQEWQQERLHFEDSRKIIRHNIGIYEEEYERRHQEALELFKAMQGGDVELYNQVMTAKSLEEHSENQLRKNRAAYEKPYFGRIDFNDIELEKEEQIYIGKNGVFRNKTEVVIADWRAPVSSAYYENELGTGTYQLPEVKGKEGVKVDIDLHLKRTYDVEDGKLNGYYDSDVASNDELLVKYLSRNKDVVLGEIIATIQKEQNEIIRESPFANQIVQGVAGSGKTTVAMHRMSYILYNYKERFTSNEFCVVGSNDLLLDYITSGLPELDVTNVKKMRMDSLFTHLLKKEWKTRYQVTEPFEDAAGRCMIGYYRELELFLLHKKEEYVNVEKLVDPDIGILLTESSNCSLFSEHKEYSAFRLLMQMDDRILTRIKSLAGQEEKEVLIKKQKQYGRHYKSQFPKITAVGLYQEFLDRRAAENGVLSNEHLQAMRKGIFDIYDVAAMLLIYYRIFQKEPDAEFGQLFIDEAQDFGSGLYYVLKQVLPGCYFTIMGDVSQNINYETGMNEWEELQRWFLTGTKDRFKLLSKSYRNTIEISEYAGKILEKASSGRYKITPVIRHGIPVVEEQFWSQDEMLERVKALIPQMQEKGYQTIAVICENDKETERVSGLLAECRVLPIRLTKGMEFDTVILWNPEKIEKLNSPKIAKLLYVAVTRALHELHVFRY